MPYIKANGIRIAFDTFGDTGKEPVFLIHGMTTQRMSQYLTAKALKDDFFVIAYDCRGHGQSDHPAYFTLEDHGRDLLALIDVLGYEKANVLGQSMGSYIALQAAETEPSRFNKLILVTPKAWDDGSGSSMQRLLKEKGSDIASVTQEEMFRLLSHALYSPEITDERREEILAMNVMTGPDAVTLNSAEMAAISRALVGFDLRSGLSRVSCPTLVLSGKNDGINPPELGKEVADGISGAVLKIMPGGHCFPKEFPEAFAEEVKAFLLA